MTNSADLPRGLGTHQGLVPQRLRYHFTEMKLNTSAMPPIAPLGTLAAMGHRRTVPAGVRLSDELLQPIITQMGAILDITGGIVYKFSRHRTLVDYKDPCSTYDAGAEQD